MKHLAKVKRSLMPSKPQKVNRSWKPERVVQSRIVDMSWFYNDRRWRRFSTWFKEKHPLCALCEAMGITSKTKYTDHIKRLREGYGADLDELKEEDYQALCDSCHAAKSGREAHGVKHKNKI